MNNDIVLYNFETVSGKFEIPIDNSLIPLNEATKNLILNAWEKCAVFDEFGRVWIISDKIHVLLRTSKENAKYISLIIINIEMEIFCIFEEVRYTKFWMKHSKMLEALDEKTIYDFQNFSIEP